MHTIFLCFLKEELEKEDTIMVRTNVQKCASENKTHRKCIPHVSPQFAFPIYLNMQSMFKIYCHMCCSFIQQWLISLKNLKCIQDTQYVFYICDGSVAVAYLGNIQGLFSVCLPFRFILVMLFTASCSIVSHNAAQRQRTEVIFLLFYFYSE